MATEDLSNVFGSGDSTANGITLDMLDYKYIDGCSNIKELEKILKVLRSGKEGFFPHLVQHCENKIEKINPKSRILRKENPITRTRDLSSDELKDITSSLDEWKNSIPNTDIKNNGHSEVKNLPPVRSARILKGDKVIEDKSEKKSQRIKGSDFSAWDKFDADAECEKIDGEEKGRKPLAKNNMKNISLKIDTTGMTADEIQQKIMNEKEKGNEAFKAGDYDEALVYYSRSINLEPLAATINNRALTYLRLKRWKDAEQDCNDVLRMEPDNLKARLRRASSRKELENFADAKEDLDFVLSKEPNNARAKKILEEVGKSLPAKKGRKMKIAEVDEEEEDIKEKVDLKNSSIKVVDGDSEETNVKSSTNSSATNNPIEEQSVESKPLVESKEEPQVKPTDQKPLPDNVERIKKEGGDFFRQGQYASASSKYSNAIDKLMSRAKIDAQSPYAHSLALLYNNRAACSLKQGDDRSCIADCTKALELKPMDVKALIRRATAYEHLERYKDSYVDFRTAQTVDWTASQAQVGANRVASHLRELMGPGWHAKITLPDVSSDVIAQARSSVTKQVQPKSDVNHILKKDEPKLEDKSNDKPKPESTKKSKSDSVQSKKAGTDVNDKTSAQTGKKLNQKANHTSNVSSKHENKEKKPLSEMDKKRLKIRQDLYEKCKADGNDLVKKGKYEEAIKSYTKCMEMLPEKVPSYTNRALCFLKLKKDISAMNDCSEALKLDANNVKAYFRRAQARKNLLQYHDAERDLNCLLSIDPNNKSALAELKVVQKLIWEKNNSFSSASSQEEKKPKRKLKIEEFSDSDNEQNEPAKTPFDQPKNKTTTTSLNEPTVENKPANDRPMKSTTSSQQPTATNKEEKQSKSKVSSDKSEATKQKKTLVLHQNMTPYEFGNQWNAVQPKTNVDAYKKILDCTPVDKIPEMVSNKTNDHMILTFALIARKYAEENNPKKAFNILNNLTKAQRFNMAAMFMSESEKTCVSEVLDLLAQENDSAAVDKLRLDYML